MENSFEQSPDAEGQSFEKEVETIIKRNEGESDLTAYALSTLSSGIRLLRLRYDLSQYSKDEIAHAFKRIFPDGQLTEDFQL